MKKLFLSILLFCVALPVMALEPCQSGSYYNPETSGTGIDIQVSEDLVALYRYGYLGMSPNYWVGATDNDSDNLVFNMYSTIRTADGWAEYNVGSAGISLNEDGSLHLIWNWSLDLSRAGEGVAIPWCLNEFCSGSEDLVPLFLPHDCQ